MAAILNEGQWEGTAGDLRALEEKYSYEKRYPQGADLRPSSELHGQIVGKLRQYIQESYTIIQNRFASWDKIDAHMTAYVDLSDQQKEDKKKEGYVKEKPISIVVPMSYAIEETLLTYLVAAFLGDTIFRYDWVGDTDADVIGALALEKIVDVQARHTKAGLALHTQWRDNLRYGFGVISTPWCEEYNIQTYTRPTTKRSFFTGRTIQTGEEEVTDYVKTFEGTKLENIPTRFCLPDPNVAIHKHQDGEFFGWLYPTNWMNLLEQEKYNDKLFNVQYIRALANAVSTHFHSVASKGAEKSQKPEANYTTSSLLRPVSVHYIYAKIIPSDWGLGSGQYPEKWMFALAGDRLLIGASPLGLNHGMFPASIAASDYDGYSVTPISKMETIWPIQKTIDWLFTSHMANVRKALNDMIIYDPTLINSLDLEDPTPGMRVRLTPNAFGRGDIDKAIQQFKVVDVTGAHIPDSQVLTEYGYRYSGAVDSVQGIMRSGSERRSATEARDTHTAALSRLAKMAYIISQQSMTDLARIYAEQTQQFMSQDARVKIVGDYIEMLKQEYGLDINNRVKNGRMLISPKDVRIPYDILVGDGTIVSGQDIQSLIQAYQIAASQPAIAAQLDMPRLFLHIMRVAGVRNINQFRVRTMPQEQINALYKSGQLATTEDLYGAPAKVSGPALPATAA